MLFPRVRFTVRRIMVVVLLGALIITQHVMVNRQYDLAKMSHDHAYRQGVWEGAARTFLDYKSVLHFERLRKLLPQPLDSSDSNTSPEDLVRDCERHAEYHARLKHKYLNASRHPWLLVPPDPPEPD